jgi:predicted nucleic acid-binding protein
MPGNFLDSNVLLYFASGDPAKAATTEALMKSGGVISVQVLNEVATVSRRKLRLSWEETDEVLATLRAALRVDPLTVETHERGLALARRYALSIYDAMIASAAILARCDTLWSEDMQDGLIVDGRLTIRNPFARPE